MTFTENYMAEAARRRREHFGEEGEGTGFTEGYLSTYLYQGEEAEATPFGPEPPRRTFAEAQAWLLKRQQPSMLEIETDMFGPRPTDVVPWVDRHLPERPEPQQLPFRPRPKQEPEPEFPELEAVLGVDPTQTAEAREQQVADIAATDRLEAMRRHQAAVEEHKGLRRLTTPVENQDQMASLLPDLAMLQAAIDTGEIVGEQADEMSEFLSVKLYETQDYWTEEQLAHHGLDHVEMPDTPWYVKLVDNRFMRYIDDVAQAGPATFLGAAEVLGWGLDQTVGRLGVPIERIRYTPEGEIRESPNLLRGLEAMLTALPRGLAFRQPDDMYGYDQPARDGTYDQRLNTREVAGVRPDWGGSGFVGDFIVGSLDLIGEIGLDPTTPITGGASPAYRQGMKAVYAVGYYSKLSELPHLTKAQQAAAHQQAAASGRRLQRKVKMQRFDSLPEATQLQILKRVEQTTVTTKKGKVKITPEMIEADLRRKYRRLRYAGIPFASPLDFVMNRHAIGSNLGDVILRRRIRKVVAAGQGDETFRGADHSDSPEWPTATDDTLTPVVAEQMNLDLFGEGAARQMDAAIGFEVGDLGGRSAARARLGRFRDRAVHASWRAGAESIGRIFKVLTGDVGSVGRTAKVLRDFLDPFLNEVRTAARVQRFWDEEAALASSPEGRAIRERMENFDADAAAAQAEVQSALLAIDNIIYAPPPQTVDEALDLAWDIDPDDLDAWDLEHSRQEGPVVLDPEREMHFDDIFDEADEAARDASGYGDDISPEVSAEVSPEVSPETGGEQLRFGTSAEQRAADLQAAIVRLEQALEKQRAIAKEWLDTHIELLDQSLARMAGRSEEAVAILKRHKEQAESRRRTFEQQLKQFDEENGISPEMGRLLDEDLELARRQREAHEVAFGGGGSNVDELGRPIVPFGPMEPSARHSLTRHAKEYDRLLRVARTTVPLDDDDLMRALADGELMGATEDFANQGRAEWAKWTMLRAWKEGEEAAAEAKAKLLGDTEKTAARELEPAEAAKEVARIEKAIDQAEKLVAKGGDIDEAIAGVVKAGRKKANQSRAHALRTARSMGPNVKAYAAARRKLDRLARSGPVLSLRNRIKDLKEQAEHIDVDLNRVNGEIKENAREVKRAKEAYANMRGQFDAGMLGRTAKAARIVDQAAETLDRARSEAARKVKELTETRTHLEASKKRVLGQVEEAEAGIDEITGKATEDLEAIDRIVHENYANLYNALRYLTNPVPGTTRQQFYSELARHMEQMDFEFLEGAPKTGPVAEAMGEPPVTQFTYPEGIPDPHLDEAYSHLIADRTASVPWGNTRARYQALLDRYDVNALEGEVGETLDAWGDRIGEINEKAAARIEEIRAMSPEEVNELTPGSPPGDGRGGGALGRLASRGPRGEVDPGPGRIRLINKVKEEAEEAVKDLLRGGMPYDSRHRILNELRIGYNRWGFEPGGAKPKPLKDPIPETDLLPEAEKYGQRLQQFEGDLPIDLNEIISAIDALREVFGDPRLFGDRMAAFNEWERVVRRRVRVRKLMDAEALDPKTYERTGASWSAIDQRRQMQHVFETEEYLADFELREEGIEGIAAAHGQFDAIRAAKVADLEEQAAKQVRGLELQLAQLKAGPMTPEKWEQVRAAREEATRAAARQETLDTGLGGLGPLMFYGPDEVSQAVAAAAGEEVLEAAAWSVGRGATDVPDQARVAKALTRVSDKKAEAKKARRRLANASRRRTTNAREAKVKQREVEKLRSEADARQAELEQAEAELKAAQEPAVRPDPAAPDAFKGQAVGQMPVALPRRYAPDWLDVETYRNWEQQRYGDDPIPPQRPWEADREYRRSDLEPDLETGAGVLVRSLLGHMPRKPIRWQDAPPPQVFGEFGPEAQEFWEALAPGTPMPTRQELVQLGRKLWRNMSGSEQRKLIAEYGDGVWERPAYLYWLGLEHRLREALDANPASTISPVVEGAPGVEGAAMGGVVMGFDQLSIDGLSLTGRTIGNVPGEFGPTHYLREGDEMIGPHPLSGEGPYSGSQADRRRKDAERGHRGKRDAAWEILKRNISTFRGAFNLRRAAASAVEQAKINLHEARMAYLAKYSEAKPVREVDDLEPEKTAEEIAKYDEEMDEAMKRVGRLEVALAKRERDLAEAEEIFEQAQARRAEGKEFYNDLLIKRRMVLLKDRDRREAYRKLKEAEEAGAKSGEIERLRKKAEKEVDELKLAQDELRVAELRAEKEAAEAAGREADEAGDAAARARETEPEEPPEGDRVLDELIDEADDKWETMVLQMGLLDWGPFTRAVDHYYRAINKVRPRAWVRRLFGDEVADMLDNVRVRSAGKVNTWIENMKAKILKRQERTVEELVKSGYAEAGDKAAEQALVGAVEKWVIRFLEMGQQKAKAFYRANELFPETPNVRGFVFEAPLSPEAMLIWEKIAAGVPVEPAQIRALQEAYIQGLEEMGLEGAAELMREALRQNDKLTRVAVKGGLSRSHINQAYFPHTLTEAGRELYASTDPKYSFIRSEIDEVRGQRDFTERGFQKERSDALQGMTVEQANEHLAKLYNLPEGTKVFHDRYLAAYAARGPSSYRAALAVDFFNKLTQMHGAGGLPLAVWEPEVAHSGAARAAGTDEASKLVKLKTEWDALELRLRATGYAGVETANGVLWVPREIADEVSTMEALLRNEQGRGKIRQFFNNHSKIWGVATTFNLIDGLGFHTRNMVSNLINNFIAGVVNPAAYKEALGLQRKMQLVRTRMFDEGLDYEEAAKGIMDERDLELAQNLRELNVVDTGLHSDLTIADDEKKVWKWLAGQQWEGGRLPRLRRVPQVTLSGGRAIAYAMESNARMAHYIAKVDQGLSHEMAAASVRNALFDYGDHTRMERNIKYFANRFYTFTARNFAFQLWGLVHAPGRTLAAARHAQGAGRETLLAQASPFEWHEDDRNSIIDPFGIQGVVAGIDSPWYAFTQASEPFVVAFKALTGQDVTQRDFHRAMRNWTSGPLSAALDIWMQGETGVHPFTGIEGSPGAERLATQLLDLAAGPWLSQFDRFVKNTTRGAGLGPIGNDPSEIHRGKEWWELLTLSHIMGLSMEPYSENYTADFMRATRWELNDLLDEIPESLRGNLYNLGLVPEYTKLNNYDKRTELADEIEAYSAEGVQAASLIHQHKELIREGVNQGFDMTTPGGPTTRGERTYEAARQAGAWKTDDHGRVMRDHNGKPMIDTQTVRSMVYYNETNPADPHISPDGDPYRREDIPPKWDAPTPEEVRTWLKDQGVTVNGVAVQGNTRLTKQLVNAYNQFHKQRPYVEGHNAKIEFGYRPTEGFYASKDGSHWWAPSDEPGGKRPARVDDLWEWMEDTWPEGSLVDARREAWREGEYVYGLEALERAAGMPLEELVNRYERANPNRVMDLQQPNLIRDPHEPERSRLPVNPWGWEDGAPRELSLEEALMGVGVDESGAREWVVPPEEVLAGVG